MDALPCRWTVRNAVRAAEGLEHTDSGHRGALSTRQLHVGQEEAETRPSRIDGLHQRHRHQSAEPAPSVKVSDGNVGLPPSMYTIWMPLPDSSNLFAMGLSSACRDPG